jgi:hypothetical protein
MFNHALYAPPPPTGLNDALVLNANASRGLTGEEFHPCDLGVIARDEGEILAG